MKFSDEPSFPSDGLFIAGTDTEVGKTYVACRIIESLVAKGRKVAAYKPVASGAESQTDSDAFRLYVASSELGTLRQVNPQFFRAPVAPPMAAELEGSNVDESLIFEGVSHWRAHCDTIVVEGAGGLLSPISWTMTNADVAMRLGYPVVLVAANRLGVVNHTLQAVRTAHACGLRIKCIVLNDVESSNLDPSRQILDPSRQSNERLLSVFLKQIDVHLPLIRLAHNASRIESPIDWSS